MAGGSVPGGDQSATMYAGGFDMIRVGVVGLGVGQVHLQEYGAHPKVRIAAVVDVNEERSQEVAEKYGVPGFRTIEEMLHGTEVDAVSLCTPPAVHAEQVEKLAQAGIHILVEKPMAPSIPDCQRMIKATRSAMVRLMVAQKKRFAPAYVFLKQKFAEDFGEPCWACVKFAHGRVDKDWFWAEQDGGGPVLENAIHMFDLLRFLMGEVETVYAQGGNMFRPDVGDQIDSAAVVLRFSNNGCATVACGYASEWGFADERVSIVTPRVCCEVSGPFDLPNRLRYIKRIDPGRPRELSFEDADGFKAEITEFVDSIETNRSPKVTGEDAAKSVTVALAVKKSIREKQPIQMANMGLQEA